MDYSVNRHEYLLRLELYCNDLVLNDKLLASLRKDFSQSMNAFEPNMTRQRTYKSTPNNKLIDEIRIKTLILTELTKNRYSCSQVIKLLRESEDESNNNIALYLEKYNKSPGRESFADDIEIEVTQIIKLNANEIESLVYPMTRNPRGKALIINNVKHLTKRESQRFNHILKQLLFDVEELEFDLTADQIKKRVTQLRDKIQNEFKTNEVKPQAVIVMVISHGEDETVLGYDACNGKNDNDIVSTKIIVDEFNKDGFDFDEPFVRLFFFTSCRIRNFMGPKTDFPFGLTSRVDNSTHTMVFYSSAESYKSFVDEKENYSLFGKYLSESISQYAYKENLKQLINRTACALRSDWESKGYFLPEFIFKELKLSLYFNPHYYYINNELENNMELFSKKSPVISESNNLFQVYNLNSREFNFKNSHLKYIAPIGKGAFGSVHKYLNILEDQFYAIKEIRFSEANKALEEIKTMAYLKSNFVVQYNTYWIEEKTLYIQMEYCIDDMKNILKNKREAFERKEVSAMNCTEYYISCEIFRQITEAVNYLHSIKPNPIIHRDLKPENILIGNSNNRLICKLSDFGISKLIDNTFSTHTAVGTPKYVAPEVSATNDLNKSKYDIRADIWSLGIIGLEVFDIENEDFINIYENNDLKEKFEKIDEILRSKLYVVRVRQRMSCKELLDEITNWFIDKVKVKSDPQNKHFYEKFCISNDYKYFHNIFLNFIH